MTKTPLDIGFEDLADAGRAASVRADAQARAAGLKVAGRTQRKSATVHTLTKPPAKDAPAPPARARPKRSPRRA